MPDDFLPFIKLRHLSLIEAITEHGTMHRAADALNMTQSTASKMLRDLEEMMGTALFVREPRGMRPTDMGAFATANAIDLLSRLRRFADEFATRRAGGFGTLVIGAIMGAAPDLVAGTVAAVKRERPLLTVRLLGETSDNILEMLESGQVDIAVGRFSTDRHRALFVFEPLAEEPLLLVVRAGHPLLRPGVGPQGLAALARWPWVLQPQATPSRQLLDAAFNKAGVELPANRVESVSIFAILHLVQSSDALALLPASVAGDHLRVGLLAPLPDQIGQSVPDFGLLSRRNEKLSEAAALFAEMLRDAASKMRAADA